MTINWRYFSLEQVNSGKEPQWKIWEQNEEYISRGLRAFQAAEAARCQSEDAFYHFHYALLRARHEQHRDIADLKVLCEIAASANLKMTNFKTDLRDRPLLAKLAEDHTFAADSLGIFGTPTIVFDHQQTIFLKLRESPPPDHCLVVFDELCQLAQQREYILEIKRP